MRARSRAVRAEAAEQRANFCGDATSTDDRQMRVLKSDEEEARRRRKKTRGRWQVAGMHSAIRQSATGSLFRALSAIANKTQQLQLLYSTRAYNVPRTISLRGGGRRCHRHNCPGIRRPRSSFLVGDGHLLPRPWTPSHVGLRFVRIVRLSGRGD